MKDDLEFLRGQMVERQLVGRGIADSRILDAFRKVPRHLFIPQKLQHQAYEDHPVPIGFGQTISQPYMVALMTQCLAPKESSRILEIGTGSGYQAAILAELSRSVYTVERIPELSRETEKRLRFLGYQNVFFRCENGAEGWEQFSPYDGILVSCASRSVPSKLVSQLKEEGLLAIPLGGPLSQVLTVVLKHKVQLEFKEICDCAFVPLVEGGSEHVS